MTVATAHVETPLRGLHASPPEPLPFAPALHIRAFLLERSAGNVLIYSSRSASELAGRGAIARAYLNHWHEAAFGADLPGVPLFVHAADRDAVAGSRRVRAAFSHRHMLGDDLEVIPTPGHTPGATAYLWDNGDHRLLFTGDTIFLRDGVWIAALLDSSDRRAYISSLELIRELDFDVLVPWAATGGRPYYDVTSSEESRLRIDAILERIGRGADH